MAYLTFARLMMDEAAPTAESAAASPNLMMVLFKAIIAVYLFVGAVRGKGKLIDNEFPKCKPETYRLVMRIMCGVTALFVLANSAFEFLSSAPAYAALLPLTAGQYATINTVLWALGLACLVALVALNIVLTDRKAMERARKQQEGERAAGRKRDPLHAAFVFDEEEENTGSFQDHENEDTSSQDGQNQP